MTGPPYWPRAVFNGPETKYGQPMQGKEIARYFARSRRRVGWRQPPASPTPAAWPPESPTRLRNLTWPGRRTNRRGEPVAHGPADSAGAVDTASCGAQDELCRTYATFCDRTWNGAREQADQIWADPPPIVSYVMANYLPIMARPLRGNLASVDFAMAGHNGWCLTHIRGPPGHELR